MTSSPDTLSRSTPPEADQFEVSIFGPGKGEALAVHLGGGDWLTVDSCWDQKNRAHPVLEYLTGCGVAVEQSVKLVVATHAHDDHVAGLGMLYGAAKSARLVTSGAIHSREFFANVKADASIEAELGQAVRNEMRTVLAEVRARAQHNRSGARPQILGRADKLLWSRPASNGIPAASIRSLSPSDEAELRARDVLAEATATAGSRRRLAAFDPNEMSVALWVQVGDQAALLGADLERGPVGCGWEAVLATHAPASKASIFKVPHHGSVNAEHAGVWADLLSGDVISVLAPFRNGSVSLPTDDDVARIISRSKQVYLTASAKGPTADAAVKRMRGSLQGLASEVRDPYGAIGQVRARWDKSAETWSCSVFPPGRELRA